MPLLEELIFRVIAECELRVPLRYHYKVTTNGTPSAHDRHRLSVDGKGTAEELVPKLEALLRVQPYALVMMTVNPDTADEFYDGVRFLRAHGAGYLITSLNFQADWDERAKKALWKSYKKLGAWYLDAYRREEKFYFAAFDKRIASHIWPGRGGSCLLGQRQISVSPDGVYYPCVQFVDRAEFALGRVGEGLDAARRTCVFERNERAKPSCAGCALLGRCNNRCGCLNISTTGTIDEVPPFHWGTIYLTSSDM